jgi:hypothetical protein
MNFKKLHKNLKFYIDNADSSKDMEIFTDGGAAELYYNNTKTFETTTEGAKVTGHLRLNNSQQIQFGGSATHIDGDSGYMAFDVNSAERMRLDSGGKLGIGGSPDCMFTIRYNGWTQANGVSLYDSYSGNQNNNFLLFYRNGNQVGSITNTLSATAFNTSSDYRLKENVDYTWDATTRLKHLKPARFNFIADNTNTLVDGFLAHEVSSIVPEAISGEKDAMTAEVLYAEGDDLPEGKSVGDVKEASVPDMQGIDQSKLVPLLVKTIQELEARITALES